MAVAEYSLSVLWVEYPKPRSFWKQRSLEYVIHLSVVKHSSACSLSYGSFNVSWNSGMLLTCKHVYVYSGDRCRLNVRGISHQCQCFYSWIAFACLYQVLRSLNISGLLIMLSCGIALSALHRQRLRVYACCNLWFYSFDGVFILLRLLVVVVCHFCVMLLKHFIHWRHAFME